MANVTFLIGSGYNLKVVGVETCWVVGGCWLVEFAPGGEEYGV